MVVTAISNIYEDIAPVRGGKVVSIIYSYITAVAFGLNYLYHGCGLWLPLWGGWLEDSCV